MVGLGWMSPSLLGRRKHRTGALSTGATNSMRLESLGSRKRAPTLIPLATAAPDPRASPVAPVATMQSAS
jgi:hypothetical protein